MHNTDNIIAFMTIEKYGVNDAETMNELYHYTMRALNANMRFDGTLLHQTHHAIQGHYDGKHYERMMMTMFNMSSIVCITRR